MTSLRPRRKAASGSVKGIFSSEKYLLFFGKTSRSSFSSERCVLRKERRTGEGYAARAKGKGRGPADAWKADAQWQDSQWQVASWDDWSWDYAEASYAAKGKGKNGKKGKRKGKYGKDSGKSEGKDGSVQLADSAPSSTTAATTFYVNHLEPWNFSFMATEEKNEAFIVPPLTPTAMVMDLGCTRAMASRVAAQDLMKFCDQNPDCGIWHQIGETTSQFTFANSESTKCNQKLVVCMYEREYAVQSTEFDIVEQSHVPIRMSLPQMRNLRFRIELHPEKALLSSPVLGSGM